MSAVSTTRALGLARSSVLDGACRARSRARTIAGDACATRDLPSPAGVVTARELHIAELTALADHHACVTDVATLMARKGDAA
ncbi:hypothetical protein EHS39_30605 [Ensifer sp. MPMI2T]|nr:hypothetical protein EHS39_30605 [Ensifer sp. MPMI2T]